MISTTLLALGLMAGPAHAHGIWGHVHVTGWAAENMPDDELRAFLLEPEVFNALLFGAAFTDSGYAAGTDASRAYSEHTHWEPFIQDFVEWIRVNDPPPWDDLESKKRVAFLMGCGSHGLQDTLFDSLFLYHVDEHDGLGQAEADPATDGFLVMDEHIRFVPERDLPMATLLQLYEVLDQEVTEEVILEHVDLMTGFYVNEPAGLEVARINGESHAPNMPWTRTHYMDPEVPGSLRAEIFPTMHYQQALWKRLHGELDPDEVAVFAFPEAPRRLLGGDAASPASWTSFVFGAGVRYEDNLLEIVDSTGAPVPFTQGNTRWGAEYTRLVRLMPDTPLQPGSWYTARLRSNLQLIDGQVSRQDVELTFQVTCDDTNAELCPDLSDQIAVASIDGLADTPTVTGDGTDDTATASDADKGCGCATGGALPPGLALLLIAGVVARRR